jgi:hypothetical protein
LWSIFAEFLYQLRQLTVFGASGEQTVHFLQLCLAWQSFKLCAHCRAKTTHILPVVVMGDQALKIANLSVEIVCQEFRPSTS